jgi:hypothetical protein
LKYNLRFGRGDVKWNFIFFRREKPGNPSFADRMAILRKSGFTVVQRGAGLMRVARSPLAVDLKDVNYSIHVEGRAGIAMGDEIGTLIGGYQKFFRTPTGKHKPAFADGLKGLHDFEEDVKEALGQEIICTTAYRIGTSESPKEFGKIRSEAAF